MNIALSPKIYKAIELGIAHEMALKFALIGGVGLVVLWVIAKLFLPKKAQWAVLLWLPIAAYIVTKQFYSPQNIIHVNLYLPDASPGYVFVVLSSNYDAFESSDGEFELRIPRSKVLYGDSLGLLSSHFRVKAWDWTRKEVKAEVHNVFKRANRSYVQIYVGDNYWKLPAKEQILDVNGVEKFVYGREKRYGKMLIK